VAAALLAALLFGAGTPLAKLLLQDVGPWMMAGLLYSGSGLGLSLYRRVTGASPVHLPRREAAWLGAAIVAGGICAPLLLMFGLAGMTASSASLLLNAEGAFTALLAWFVFRENFDRRIALGMAAVLTGALILSWPDEPRMQATLPALAILGACLAWAVDNNLTRKVALHDAVWIAAVKGLCAGLVNLGLALLLGAHLPAPPYLLGALLLGLLAYGVSLSLFVVSLRHLGTARTGAYFSVAPFFGALLAVLLGEALTLPLLIAGCLMAVGVWLHLAEQHQHEHVHEPLEHDHPHVHDEHHQHAHSEAVSADSAHSHRHSHGPLTHRHVHFPDAHHRHDH
jgi:drug/metabolite transporter (DMT)-like permease